VLTERNILATGRSPFMVSLRPTTGFTAALGKRTSVQGPRGVQARVLPEGLQCAHALRPVLYFPKCLSLSLLLGRGSVVGMLVLGIAGVGGCWAQVRCFYSSTPRNSLYLVMEYLDGGTCTRCCRGVGYLDESTSRFHIAELVSGPGTPCSPCLC